MITGKLQWRIGHRFPCKQYMQLAFVNWPKKADCHTWKISSHSGCLTHCVAILMKFFLSSRALTNAYITGVRFSQWVRQPGSRRALAGTLSQERPSVLGRARHIHHNTLSCRFPKRCTASVPNTHYFRLVCLIKAEDPWYYAAQQTGRGELHYILFDDKLMENAWWYGGCKDSCLILDNSLWNLQDILIGFPLLHRGKNFYGGKLF